MSDVLVKRATVAPPAIPATESLAEVQDSPHDFLAFVIGDETFGLPLHSIREILKPPPMTGVPRAAPDVLGIVTVRGSIITIIDLRRLFGVAERESDKSARVLLVDSGDEVMGLLVDRVIQVYRLASEEIESTDTVASELSDYVMGIGRRARGLRGKRADDEILILLDPVPLLRR